MDTFRETNITVEGNDINVKFRKIADIFTFHDTPYIAVGPSGSGKSVIANDVFFQYAKEASKMFYISSTEETMNDNPIPCLDNCFKRNISFETLNLIWEDIKQTFERYNKPINELLSIISKIYSSNEFKIIKATYDESISKIKSKSNGNSDNESIFSSEVLSRLITSGLEKYPESIEKFNLTEKQYMKVYSSRPPKTILILDDVSSELDNLNTSGKKVTYNGAVTPIAKAFKGLMKDILTKARHYNTIIIFFVHSWESIQMKDNIRNFILLNETVVDSMMRFRTIPNNVKTIIQKLSPQVFKVYKHNFIIYKDDINQTIVSKAELHGNNKAELDPINQKYVEIYNKISTNTLDQIKHEESINEIPDELDNLI